MIDACIKAHISSLSKETSKRDESLVYALSMLPYHFMKSEKIAEAYHLLLSKSFVTNRIKAVSFQFIFYMYIPLFSNIDIENN